MPYDALTWISCYWDELAEYPPHAGPAELMPGVLHIPPPVKGLTFRDGMWDLLNHLHGTMFDVAETETLPPNKAREIAEAILEFGRRNYERLGPDSIVSAQPAQSWEMRAGDLLQWLNRLSAFLRDAAEKGKAVTILL